MWRSDNGSRKLRGCLNQRRTSHGPLSCFTPKAHSLLDQTGLSAVARQQFGLGLGNFGELALKCFRNAGVKRSSRLTQQGAVGRVLDQCVFEEISRVRR